jgi:hypothetical protein
MTGAGLPAAECVALLRAHDRDADLRLLTDDVLWGKPITDERYLIVSESGRERQGSDGRVRYCV